MKKIFFLFIFLPLNFVLMMPISYSKGLTHEGLFILDSQRNYLPLLQTSGDFTFDHPSPEGYELYGPPGLREWIKDQRIPHRELIEAQLTPLLVDDYPTPAEIEEVLHQLHEQYPQLTKLFSIGKTHDQRELWMMKISDNPHEDEVEPEVKYVANMHGDEILGREFLILLLKDLLEGYSKQDPYYTKLIDNTEIFILPSLNPDGMSQARRGNGQYVDLNRNFPDFTTSDSENTWENREPETRAMMKFQRSQHFSLSANFHGGAVVVNYPWDTEERRHPFNNLVIDLAKGYASSVQEMNRSRAFPNGITNGYDWYEVNGGMQDWSYYYHGDLQLTMELSNPKWPSYRQVPQYYKDHKVSLLNFLYRVHQGAGFKIQENRELSGTVEIFLLSAKGFKGKESSLGQYPFFQSEFYKVLGPGNYEFVIKMAKYEPISFTTKVSKDRVSPNGSFTKILLP